jgi:hypothetical protein
MPLALEIQGERKVSQQFDRFPTIAHDKLLERITALTDRLYAAVLAAEPRKTGRLAETTKRTVYDDSGRRIAGVVTVDADFAKAATLEYGSHKTITIGQIPGFARARQAKRSVKVDMKIARGIVGASFQRTLNITALYYLRGPLAEIADDAIIEMQGALEEATRQSGQ